MKLILKEKNRIAESLAIFKFKADSKFDFKPGQYITLVADINNKKFIRPYSIASSPSEIPMVELYIKLITEENKGTFTKYLFNCKIEQEFEILKVNGLFILNNIPRNKYFGRSILIPERIGKLYCHGIALCNILKLTIANS